MRTLEKILCIDDDADILAIAELALRSVGGFEVALADSGERGLCRAGEFQPDLILLDVMMPELDGPSVLARLRQDETTADIPVVFMTARVQPLEVQEYRDLGADGVIDKPFDPISLPEQLRRVWECVHE